MISAAVRIKHCNGFTDKAALLYLDDEKHGRRGVKGTIVEGDDGGAVSSEQVSHLPGTQTQNVHLWVVGGFRGV